MEAETYLERIKKLKSQQKITNDKLSEMTGIPLGTLSKLLAGISDSPKLANIVAISRALDCSLDWLITGVPENTNNYTLEPAEMTLVELYRSLDDYGRDLAVTVMVKERDRAERQADHEAIRLHDVARRTARRTANRIRRPDESPVAGARTAKPDPLLIPTAGADPLAAARADSALEAAAAHTVSLTMEKTPPRLTDAPAAHLTPERVTRTNTPEAPETTVVPTGGTTGGTATGTAGTTILSVPRSVMERTGVLPTGLRRRSIGLYDMPVSAGVGELLADSTRTDIVIPDDPRTAEADYALRINGDSMEPKYHSGDIILIQNAESVEEGELGIFVLDGSGYFKKYGGDHLISLNTKYPPIRLRDFADVACCGRVVGKLKRK